MFRIGRSFVRRTHLLAAGCSAMLLLGACSRDPEVAKREYLEAGNRLFAEQKYREAIVEYLNAVRTDGTFGEARMKLADAYDLSGNRANAIRQRIAAADTAPANIEWQLIAARALMQAGRFEDAGARAEAVIARDPANVDAYVMRGAAALGQDDVNGAIADLESAVKLDPQRLMSYLELASLRIRTGSSAEAEAAFKQAIAVDPRSVLARLWLANYYASTGRVGLAEASIQEALKVDPKNVDANRTLALLYLSTERPDIAEAPLRLAAEAPEALGAKLLLADYYNVRNRPAEALTILNELAARPEALLEARLRIARIDYAAGRRDEAHRALDELVAKDPATVRARVLKGTWLVGEKKLDEAFAQASAAVAADQRFVEARALLGSIHAARGNTGQAIDEYTEALRIQPGHVVSQLELARLNLVLGRTDQAVTISTQVVKNQPASGAARLLLARALLAQGNLQAAGTELALLIKSAPEVAPVHVAMGQLEARRGNTVAARRSFERALALDAASRDAVAGLASSDIAEKRVPDAIRRMDALVGASPSDPQVLALASRTYVLAGDFARAEASARKALELDSSSLPMYGLLGQIFVRQRKLDQALQEYERLIGNRPNDVAAHTMVAMILQVQNRSDEAKKRYERILEIDARAPVAANNLAYLDAEAGSNLDVALNRAQIAKAALPDDPDVNDTLGWVYYKQNLARAAIPPLELSVQIGPANAVYHFHLGMAYLKAGETAKARQSLQQALKLDAALEDARKALASIPG